MTVTQRTRQVRPNFDESTPVSIDALAAAGLFDYQPSLNGQTFASRNREADAMDEAIDRKRKHLLPHQRDGMKRAELRLRALAKRSTSFATRAAALAGAKRIADEIAADDRRHGRVAERFAEAVAVQMEQSKRTVERSIALGARLLPDLVKAIAGGRYDDPSNLEILAALSPERQLAFAREAARRKEENNLAHAVARDGRLKKLDHAVLDALDTLGRNDEQTRRRLAAMSQRDAIDEVAQMQRGQQAADRRARTIERLRSEAKATILTPAADALGGLFAAATPADRSRFMEIHGLRRAPTIPGEHISVAFSVIEEAEQTNA